MSRAQQIRDHVTQNKAAVKEWLLKAQAHGTVYFNREKTGRSSTGYPISYYTLWTIVVEENDGGLRCDPVSSLDSTRDANLVMLWPEYHSEDDVYCKAAKAIYFDPRHRTFKFQGYIFELIAALAAAAGIPQPDAFANQIHKESLGRYE